MSKLLIKRINSIFSSCKAIKKYVSCTLYSYHKLRHFHIKRLNHNRNSLFTLNRYSFTNNNNDQMSAEVLEMANGVLSGNRRDLSRAITLIESTNSDHYKQAQLLLSYIYNKQNTNFNRTKSLRIGITGPPGAGKSTFINKLGSILCSSAYNNKIAVLPIDPSSFLSGGSILGDQTRMLDLFRSNNTYLRPSPNKLSLGGITDTTYEVCQLCDAANYNIIFVETVGVGQAEIEVANFVDIFILVVTPSSGDDLQGLKRGIMEMADIIVVNKAENDQMKSARLIRNDFQRALSLINTRRSNIGWSPKIVLCSSLPDNVQYQQSIANDKEIKDNENNIINVWKEIELFQNTMEQNGEFDKCRREQSKYATWKYVWRNIKNNVESQQDQLINIENSVMDNQISPREGSQKILNHIWSNAPKI